MEYKTWKRKEELNDARRVLIDYLRIKSIEQDWHGVQDAASDLRDIDSEMKGLRAINDNG